MTVDEPSGSFRLSPTTQPNGTGAITFDVRTIGMAVLFLLGGGASGIGTSMLGGSGVKEQIEKLADQVAALTRPVDGLAAEGRSTEREHTTYREELADHESRIRKLEQADRRP